MRPKKQIQEINAIKRRLHDDLLRVQERCRLFGSGLIRTTALRRECEECIAHRFRQLLMLANQIAIANPMNWAKAAVLKVLQPFSDDPEILRIFSRVYDEVLLEPNATVAKQRVVRRAPRKLTKQQQALAAMTELWRANAKATYKEIIELADGSPMPTPWDDSPTWSDAMAKRENAVKSLLAKARARSKEEA